MVAGEYVSVSSQHDTEQADLGRESEELRVDPAAEQAELARIYIEGGLTPSLASQVATQLMAHDALGDHTRDELGLSDTKTAKPIQASIASAAALPLERPGPLAIAMIAPPTWIVVSVAVASLMLLMVLGRGGREDWRGEDRGGRRPCHLLGRLGYGHYRRAPPRLWDRGLGG